MQSRDTRGKMGWSKPFKCCTGHGNQGSCWEVDNLCKLICLLYMPWCIIPFRLPVSHILEARTVSSFLSKPLLYTLKCLFKNKMQKYMENLQEGSIHYLLESFLILSIVFEVCRKTLCSLNIFSLLLNAPSPRDF